MESSTVQYADRQAGRRVEGHVLATVVGGNLPQLLVTKRNLVYRAFRNWKLKCAAIGSLGKDTIDKRFQEFRIFQTISLFQRGYTEESQKFSAPFWPEKVEYISK